MIGDVLQRPAGVFCRMGAGVGLQELPGSPAVQGALFLWEWEQFRGLGGPVPSRSLA